MRRPSHQALRSLAVALMSVIASSLGAQAQRAGQLRVLRFLPEGVAGPTDSLVIAFDHPVAPALDRSVEAGGVVRLDPSVRTTAYWRDPSTIVVRFAEPLAFDARYQVTLAPELRSVDGAPIADGQGRELRVRKPQLLLVYFSGGRQYPDSLQRPFAVYEGAVPATHLSGRLVAVRNGDGCPAGMIAMRPDSVRAILPTDPAEVREAGGPQRDRRLDGLRHVVRFVAKRSIPDGCLMMAQVSGEPGGAEHEAGPFLVAARFAVTDVGCTISPCEQGFVVVSFSHPVRASEVEKHVRVDGAPARAPWGNNGREGASTRWQLAQQLAPGRTVAVSIDGTITDAFGRALGANVRRTVVGAHLRPSVDFITGPVIVPRDAGMLFAVRHTNTDSITIALGRVADSLRPTVLGSSWYGYPDRQSRMEPDSIVRVVATRGAFDRATTFVVPASWIPRAWRDEPLLLLRAWPTSATRSNQAAVRWASYAAIERTSLAAHVIHGQGMLDVWVTALRDATPVAGARLRLLDSGTHELATGTTDEHGRARLHFATPAADGWESGALVEVSARDERTLLAFQAYERRSQAPDEDAEGQRGYVQRTGGELPDGRTLHGVVFADRGIYRPGERIHVKGMVRTSRPDADFSTPAGDSVRWTLAAYDHRSPPQQIARVLGVLSAFGTADTVFDVPRTAALGTYTATLSYRVAGSWRVAASTEITTAEYRPVEFEASLDGDTSVALFSGDTARLRASARYLFGMPMDGGKLEWSARIEERNYWSEPARPKVLEGFRVGRGWWRGGPAANPPQPRYSSGSATLAHDGTATIVAPIGRVTSASTLVVSAAVTDANRRTVTTERQLVVHAADAYVGVRVHPWRWMRSVGDTIPLELLAVRANGALRPGTPITLRAVRDGWSNDGRRADTVWRARVVSSDSVVRAVFVPTSAGWYEIEASATDAKGRVATTGYDLWVTGAEWVARAGRAMTITMDRQSYAPGDTAIAVIESPTEQRAWVTLSTSVPLVEREVTLHRGANVVRIPVPLAAMPTAQLGVIAIEPIAGSRDSVESHVNIAEQMLTVATSARELDVRVSPERARYAPGDTVTLHVHVRDAAGIGRRAEATLWAVDQGVAALTGLQKPALIEPLLAGSDRVTGTSTLTAPVLTTLHGAWPDEWMRIRIRGMSSRMALEEVVVTGYGAASVVPGLSDRSAAGKGLGLRSVFATTPFWNASVVTDAAGDATTRFVLPHNVTTFRLFSAAITAGTEVGSGDTSLVATRPLLVRAALPRVVRLGDTLFAGGVITQDTTARTPVRLAIETRGLELESLHDRTATLDGRRASELRYPLRVTSSDSVSVTLRAYGGGHTDAVRTTLPVSPAGHERAHVVMGTLERKADVALPAVEGADPERSRVMLQLGVSPLGIVKQLDYSLRIYPYYCTEQITSAARALLARNALERVLDGESELAPSDRAQLERGVAVLVSRQREDGAIGYWGPTDWSTPWLTAYALSMLLDARDAGIHVPATTIARATAYLSTGNVDRTSTRWSTGPDASPHDLLAALRALRRAGVSDTVLERRVKALASRLAYVDRLDYAIMLAERGDSASARSIVHEAWRATHVEGRLVRFDDSTHGNGWLFPSSQRPAARLFVATAMVEPHHPQLGALFESIMQMGRSGSRWGWNTIEQAELAEAIVGARAVFGFGEARAVTVSTPARGTLTTSRFAAGRTDSATFSLAALGAERGASAPRLTLEADSPTPIYYAATLLETPRARPVRGDDAGLGVERWYESFTTGKPLTSVSEGELVRVRLRVLVPSDRQFVAVTDLLPAGLEAVDLSLRTSSTLAPFAGAPRRNDRDDESPPGGRWGYGSWDSGWWTPWEHKEIRDDRVHWFARRLWKGTFEISYVARATTAGTFVRPPAYAEEMYNPAVHGRSDGGWFTVTQAAAH